MLSFPFLSVFLLILKCSLRRPGKIAQTSIALLSRIFSSFYLFPFSLSSRSSSMFSFVTEVEWIRAKQSTVLLLVFFFSFCHSSLPLFSSLFFLFHLRGQGYHSMTFHSLTLFSLASPYLFLLTFLSLCTVYSSPFSLPFRRLGYKRKSLGLNCHIYNLLWLFLQSFTLSIFAHFNFPLTHTIVFQI